MNQTKNVKRQAQRHEITQQINDAKEDMKTKRKEEIENKRQLQKAKTYLNLTDNDLLNVDAVNYDELIELAKQNPVIFNEIIKNKQFAALGKEIEKYEKKVAKEEAEVEKQAKDIEKQVVDEVQDIIRREEDVSKREATHTESHKNYDKAQYRAMFNVTTTDSESGSRSERIVRVPPLRLFITKEFHGLDEEAVKKKISALHRQHILPEDELKKLKNIKTIIRSHHLRLLLIFQRNIKK
ncbi:hypothetical protein PAPYR_12349 [Paratrimastix pyriformis]|uniref:Uncharacterized protein n=1 Tax=Paratrimastix pyriformis TaxID=342808 RepID=A0ABQ8U3M9_9EUKA|nr:hypothetical protein PAPYR_12349 [Paratrimastix pyriformis]